MIDLKILWSENVEISLRILILILLWRFSNNICGRDEIDDEDVRVNQGFPKLQTKREDCKYEKNIISKNNKNYDDWDIGSCSKSIFAFLYMTSSVFKNICINSFKYVLLNNLSIIQCTNGKKNAC